MFQKVLVLDAIHFKKARSIIIASTALINEDFKTLVIILFQENSVYLVYFEQKHFIGAMKLYMEDIFG
jgi:hypothetical protein